MRQGSGEGVSQETQVTWRCGRGGQGQANRWALQERSPAGPWCGVFSLNIKAQEKIISWRPQEKTLF